jgi:hypothetical protein
MEPVNILQGSVEHKPKKVKNKSNYWDEMWEGK